MLVVSRSVATHTYPKHKVETNQQKASTTNSTTHCYVRCLNAVWLTVEEINYQLLSIKKKQCLLSIVQHIAHNLAPSFSHTRACINCMQTCSNRIHLYCSITAYSYFSKTTRFGAPHRLVTEKKMETLKISWHSSLKTECAFQDKKKRNFLLLSFT